MTIWDNEMKWLLCGLFGILIFASVVGYLLSLKKQNATIANLNARIRAWWAMCIIAIVAILIGQIGSLVLFALMSFYALRECITLTPTQRGDHEALFWCFFIILPLQYVLIGIEWYGVFVIMLPVYASLFLPARIALAGDTRNFLERAAKIQWSMMIAVYCVSHIPALLMLDIPGYENQNAKLLLFLMIVVQISDVLQYVFGKLWGKHPIVPKVSPNKTREGFIGGILSASLVGMGLYWITPFSWWQALLISLLITLLGFLGGLCMSAIKRDQGVKDFGAMLEGHGGMMDRIDSLCFAAPVFFHVVRFYYT
ncbi:phosphatidate cytidylyltransferase [Affinibrenneria salicis]|uniref:Phosphatidate cytidylyltransferase n=1 Tax=Affinibrenneria salicis TaxID=2590031 RepID=A0A5J5FXX5_9GAMM|nr:phosphatidate cytidylyltransferase [Affinibrenneria salicis]KAA8998964.1 phosphatidate cytidylyltransferase [Affinibrenneria salicis]